MPSIHSPENGILTRAGMFALLTALAIVVGARQGLAEEVAADAPPAWQPEAVPGTLFICGGGRIAEPLLERFVEFAGGPRAHLVVITTASETADSHEVESRIEVWKRFKFADLTVLHTRSRDTADDPSFARPLESATGVWFIGGHQQRLVDAYLNTTTQSQMRRVLERGGVVGGTSAGAAVMSPVMIRGGNPQPEIGDGFGFLPGTIVDQHFLKRKRQDRLLRVCHAFPRLVGVGIDEGTVLVVQGRRLSVLGDSNVVTCLASVGDKPPQVRMLEPGDEADLVALSRAAMARVKPRLPLGNEPPECELENGTLVIAGGGEVPAEAAMRFIEAAGGVDAPLVVVTTAAGDQPAFEEAADWLTRSGATNVTTVHPRSFRDSADPQFLDRLRKAGGVWFIGGRQWRLVDALFDTPAEKLLHELLKRDGAIGGTAAGASILASYLVRGGPLTNREIMAEGYEEGFGFLPGVAIDPFFTQRNRFADMLSLKNTHRSLLGLGIDSETAVVVTGRVMEVIGPNHVAVYDRPEPAQTGESEFDILYDGDQYDLFERRRLGPDREVVPVIANADSDEEAESADEPEPQPPLVCE